MTDEPTHEQLMSFAQAGNSAQEEVNRVIEAVNELMTSFEFVGDELDRGDPTNPFWPMEAFRFQPDLSEEEWTP